MLRRRLLFLFALPIVGTACQGDPPTVPVVPSRPALAAASCALGVSDAVARLQLAAMTAAVTTLETSGALSSGQANALRNHLANALRQIDAGRYCAAIAQLEAFEDQVGDFVEGGALTTAQGEALTDAATQVVVGAPNTVTINPPSAAAGTYQAGFANFGPAPTVTGVSGAIVLVNDGGANTQSNPDLGCGPLIGFPPGAIALAQRGDCNFTVKAQHAQAAGAVALIIFDNVESFNGLPLNLGGTDPSITIPVVGVTRAAGATIKAGLPATGTVATKPAT